MTSAYQTHNWVTSDSIWKATCTMCGVGSITPGDIDYPCPGAPTSIKVEPATRSSGLQWNAWDERGAIAVVVMEQPDPTRIRIGVASPHGAIPTAELTLDQARSLIAWLKEATKPEVENWS